LDIVVDCDLALDIPSPQALLASQIFGNNLVASMRHQDFESAWSVNVLQAFSVLAPDPCGLKLYSLIKQDTFYGYIDLTIVGCRYYR